MVKKEVGYPVQMASIEKGKWRMQIFIDEGLGKDGLAKKENELWKQIKGIADKASPSPATCLVFPGSKLIGYGWEWAVYHLPDTDRVGKVPAGIFPEINNPVYLDNSRAAYDVCRQFFGHFMVETTFERQNTIRGPLNVLFQKRLPGEQYRDINLLELSPELRESFRLLGEKVITILQELEWAPDFNLYKKKVAGEQVWSIWNIMLEEGQPRIFDFTAYYDVFRLYPERTGQEVKIKIKNWQTFLKELKR